MKEVGCHCNLRGKKQRKQERRQALVIFLLTSFLCNFSILLTFFLESSFLEFQLLFFFPLPLRVSVQVESIEGYISESGHLQDLHSQILDCDEVLDSMEDMLGRFQSDLSEISSEIKHIQKQSLSLNVKLKNRRELHEKLSKFADNMQIPPTLIDVVLDSEVSSAEYLASLQLLHKKLNFLRSSKDAQNSLAFQDVAPELSKLETKAVSKVKAFLLEQFSILRKPKTNIQIQQQNRLLRLKGFVSFIKQHNQVAYKEIRTNYTETVGNVLLSHFRVYLSHVASLETRVATRNDLVGELAGGSTPFGGSTNALSGVSNFFSSMKSLGGLSTNQGRRAAAAQNRKDCFKLEGREEILTKLDESAVVPHLAESQGVKMGCEQIFRSINKLLLDSSSSEFIFSTEFFRDTNVFQETMSEVIALITEHLTGWVQDLHDPIGLLLMVRINYCHRLIMQRRRLPCLDAYMDNVNMILWPKLKLVLDSQLDSLTNAHSVIAGKKGSGFGITGGGNSNRFFIDPTLAKNVEGITNRFADLLLALVTLNENFDQGQLAGTMDRLVTAMEELLFGIAKGIKEAASQQSGPTGVAASAAFLVNNFGQLRETLKDSSFKTFLMHYEDALSLYVSEILKWALGAKMIHIVSDEEGETAQKDVLEEIINHFDPAASIKKLADQVHMDFTSPSAKKEVLKATLTQLLLYYTRFVEVLKKVDPELLKEAVTIPSIMYEIKKFKT